MAAKKKARAKRPPGQSGRFVKTARALEAAGELSLTDAGEHFERVFKAVTPPRLPKRRTTAASNSESK